MDGKESHRNGQRETEWNRETGQQGQRDTELKREAKTQGEEEVRGKEKTGQSDEDRGRDTGEMGSVRKCIVFKAGGLGQGGRPEGGGCRQRAQSHPQTNSRRRGNGRNQGDHPFQLCAAHWASRSPPTWSHLAAFFPLVQLLTCRRGDEGPEEKGFGTQGPR